MKDISIWDASETRRVIVVYTYEAETLVFKVLYQSVISLNGLRFVSARPALHPSVSVFVKQRILEINPFCWFVCMGLHLFFLDYWTERSVPLVFWLNCITDSQWTSNRQTFVGSKADSTGIRNEPSRTIYGQYLSVRAPLQSFHKPGTVPSFAFAVKL